MQFLQPGSVSGTEFGSRTRVRRLASLTGSAPDLAKAISYEDGAESAQNLSPRNCRHLPSLLLAGLMKWSVTWRRWTGALSLLTRSTRPSATASLPLRFLSMRRPSEGKATTTALIIMIIGKQGTRMPSTVGRDHYSFILIILYYLYIFTHT